MAASTSFLLQSPEPDLRTTEWEKCFVCQINEAKSVKLTEPSKRNGKLTKICIFFILAVSRLYVNVLFPGEG